MYTFSRCETERLQMNYGRPSEEQDFLVLKGLTRWCLLFSFFFPELNLILILNLILCKTPTWGICAQIHVIQQMNFFRVFEIQTTFDYRF